MGNPPSGILREFLARTVPRSPGKVKCKAATLPRNSAPGPMESGLAFFSRLRMRFMVRCSEMEFAMRIIEAAVFKALGLVAIGTMLALSPVRADTVPPFQGNDTGGIIAYSLTATTDIRTLAINHCASYGKVAKFLAVEPHYGGYISFSCRWLPYGERAPVRAAY
jgi:hypothetical protein